jgi:ribosome biogenesis GTPase A
VQIKAVIPLSAKRGWYVDDLVEAIERHSNLTLGRKGQPLPTYFVGVTNVGKSSVINAIAHKLYVPQPPHPTSKKQWFTYTDDKTGAEKISYRWDTEKHLNMTEMVESRARRTKEQTALMTTSPLPGTTINAVAVRVTLNKGDAGRCFLFDTPGLYPHWQLSSPLSIAQMSKALIRHYRNPDCYVLRAGSTIFIAGVAAIDVVKAPAQVMFGLYTSESTKSTICGTDAADAFWAENVGGALSPPGSPQQLQDLRLTVKRTYLFECFQRHRKNPKADIYVCGIGWVSFFSSEPGDIVLAVRTLPGIVHGVRQPLRMRDMHMFRPWPKLPLSATTRDPKPAVQTLVKLTSGPFDPAAPAVTPVVKTRPLDVAGASSAPFDFIVEQLKQQGKLP